MKKNLLITTAAAAILATTGLATAQDQSGKPAGAMEKAAPQVQMRGASQPRGHERRPSEPMAEKPAKGMQHSDKDMTPSDKSTHKSMQKSETDRHSSGARQGADAQHRDDKRAGTRNRSETTGRGDTANVRFNSEQRTRIRKVVVSKKIPKVTRVNFTVSIGAHVPRTVKFHPIPTEIVTIHPAWRGYRVILVGSELLIINPRTYEIVDVIVV
jgi:Protein of unknown function (DUF1236)